MDAFEQQDIPKELIHSLVSFAYCEGLLQGMGEASGERTWKSRPTTSEQIDDLVHRWFKVEEISND